jgi:hypothetical protein
LSRLCSLSSRRYRLSPTFHKDNPEYGPGAIFGASGVFTSSASASSTGSPPTTPPPNGSGSNTGAIVGGVVGGIAVVSIAVVAIFYLRQRSWAPSARSAGLDAFQPHMDEIPRPLSDRGTVGPSSPSIRTKFSVRVPRSSRCTYVSSCHRPISVHPGRAK